MGVAKQSLDLEWEWSWRETSYYPHKKSEEPSIEKMDNKISSRS